MKAVAYGDPVALLWLGVGTYRFVGVGASGKRAGGFTRSASRRRFCSLVTAFVSLTIPCLVLVCATINGRM